MFLGDNVFIFRTQIIHRHTCNYVKSIFAYIHVSTHIKRNPVSWLDHPHLCYLTTLQKEGDLTSKLAGLWTVPTQTGRMNENTFIIMLWTHCILQQPLLLGEASSLPEATFPPKAFAKDDVPSPPSRLASSALKRRYTWMTKILDSLQIKNPEDLRIFRRHPNIQTLSLVFGSEYQLTKNVNYGDILTFRNYRH